MKRFSGQTILITGANSGIGKEIARQLGKSSGAVRVILACRNEMKASAAKKELEESTGKNVFEILKLDVSNLESVKQAVSNLTSPVDTLIMNAGGMGGPTPSRLTKDGVTEMFASNILGHVALLEDLISAKKLRGTAILAGSEAAAGVPALGIKKPEFKSYSTDEFTSICNGKYFDGKKFDLSLAYAQAKYMGAAWMASVARKNPDLRFITISPGSTQGTEVISGMTLPLRLLMKFLIMPVVLPIFGMAHKLEIGAQRLIDAIDNPGLMSGHFYASKPGKLTGPVVDQSNVIIDLANERYQDHASEAIHRFLI